MGELSIILTTTELILPIHRFSQENLTSAHKQTGPYIVYHGMRRTKNKLITGEINCDIKEEPPKLGRIKIKRRIVPNLLKNFSTSYAYFFGKIPTKILPPSKGCIGTRLKIASDTFKIINGTANRENNGLIRPINETISASNKFDAGPASEIKAESRLGFLRLYGSNSTGFAQPKGITEAPKALIIDSPKSNVVPIGS